MVDGSRNAGAPGSRPEVGPNTVAGSLASDSTVVSGTTPRRIGRYELLERLGVGGMAEVYLATQAGAVGFQKKVVVKRILPHLAADRQFVEMFAREAKVAARVSHANVVQIFELGEEGTELFIAMEYLDGLTLHRLAASSWEKGWAVPVDVVIRTMADAATGLHAAHGLTDEQGRSLHLVHRDVSPDNLMVSKDGVTKVLDFGIAKGDVGGPKTKTGNLRGKIPFMPPEQITGEVLDGRADLYALGVSMYWMLTGDRPFDRQSDWHTMHAILNDAPKPPSIMNPAVSAGLDQLILQLLEKTREKRPASGREVADRLEELASAGSVGGKKTTVSFLGQLLPTSQDRGNPVSEVQPVPEPGTSDVPNATLPAYEAARLASQEPSLPAPIAAAPILSPPAPAPISALEPMPGASSLPSSPAPDHTVPLATGVAGPDVTNDLSGVKADGALAGASIMPLVPAATASPHVPNVPHAPNVPHGAEDAIRPVTTPAAPNAISNVLTPAPRGGPPVALIVFGLIVVVGSIAGVGIAWQNGVFGGTDVVGADAGVASAVADAGTSIPVVPPPPPGQPPPPPPPPPPPAGAFPTATVQAKNTPARIRWRAGDTVVGLGSGTLTVPAGTMMLIAEDLRWHTLASVPVIAGVADYEAVPKGTVQLVRTSDAIKVTLGDDDISKQRRLNLPVGRYIFTVEKGGKKREVPVEIVAGKTITIDVAR